MKKPASEAQPLTDIVARIIDEYRGEPRISPSWVATQAMAELDPDRSSVRLVYLGCHLELRQIARSVLRMRFEDEDGRDDDDDPTRQHELFPELQWRYPTARSRDAEPEYVRLEFLTDGDIQFNVERLRREGRSKLAHADALEAHGRGRKRRA